MSQPQAKFLKDYQAPDFHISHINLDFSLAGKETKIVATSKVKRQGQHKAPLILVGDDIVLQALLINGSPASYTERTGELVIDTELDEFELQISSSLDPEANTSLEGLYMSDGAYCTQCEAEGFRRITYFLDRPDVLAIYTVRITADKQAFPYLLSNGNLIETGELDGGLHFAQWHDPFPKPAYLFALVAGDFDLLEDEFTTCSNRKVKLQVYVDKGNLHKAHHAMASLKKSMAWDESRFNLEYDLDVYMIVAVDFFNMGAMENKGLNVFNTKFVLADKDSATDDDYHGIESVVGHEYFHNWTGNRVTCRDWFQLSLKEGLTVFRDQEFSSDLGSRAVNRIHAIKVMKNQQFAEDSGPMAHPIRPESVIEMNNFYTVTVYNKGAEVIRMMHTLLGETSFQKGMALYFERHDGQAVTCDDFVAAMQDASGVDLTQFKRWYSQAGTPQVDVTEEFNSQTSTYTLTLGQSIPATPDGSAKLPLHIPFDIELIDNDGQSIVNKVLDFTEAKQVFEFKGLTQKPVASLLQDFSAPVKLCFDYSVEQLVHIMRYASSEVAKWEASVALFSQSVWQNVERLQAQQAMFIDPRIIDAFKGVLLAEDLDKALMAEILTMPSAGSLIEQTQAVDLDNLALAREFVVGEIACQCEDELAATVRALTGVDDAATRSLKNIGLYLLVKVDNSYSSLASEQFDQASNMTDSLAALTALNAEPSAMREQLMTQFEQKWLKTPLVMDKWFALHATLNHTCCIDTLKSLFEHEAFSFNNPNRVRSLIGVFAAMNTFEFHRKDGAGYQFLADAIIKLNTLNPQVAARIITPLIQFKKFDQQRQSLMISQLKRILQVDGLSKDLYEKVTKALA
ncbi:aminopeptidase N [Shewanella fidelis]|uniref:Aminopeptidase N n=1 Tax=Shewanella fidelis TaxID=173509 RepID=A0AAW8NMS5_9GAMM|nr:aminopeptidase N [Shewanella fidelis]MDR8523670.1 aminopeptidase N [Shewanella fidelis]MDW4810217.1 aminopeptidase N [Shewanella fidelis]MDW4814362.1 aminopeptidase N [Shewanella fidelis]MDW4818453.1 aminopeptidase N [Shewanella fidelis]MDW4823895.1 aminopeptidase N [Shewanella fidelis]